ncbi:hypothetical protein HOLleu_11688 [Holothuria leucospilota]|uniref:Uncharacterized protein n=1 Tax=Holothuria leucospilota TaxID=206669 RepID=A0A9Q1CFZ7_HOLLE|nr:hypothetical protein HOLleu_11688 [Holothuria leucospilota]
MAHKFLILISVVILWLQGVNSLEQKHLTDLREFRIQGLASKVEVPRSVVEDIFNNITTDSDWDLSLSKPESNNIFYDTHGTLFLGHAVIHDHTLSGLSCEMKERVAASYDTVNVALSFVSGGQHGIILLDLFTDSDKDVFFPYSTNWNHVHYIDQIEEAENGTITLRQGNDVMVLNTHHNYTCSKSQHYDVREEFNEITGESFTSTDYPLAFDWGCDVFGDEVDFCDILKQNEKDLKKAGSNVCTEMTITYQSKRCSATLAIQQMTGFFRNELPYFSAPSKRFEAEWVDREHGAGIVFPCFSV